MSWVKYVKIMRWTAIIGHTKKVLSIKVFDLYSQINTMYTPRQLDKYVT